MWVRAWRLLSGRARVPGAQRRGAERSRSDALSLGESGKTSTQARDAWVDPRRSRRVTLTKQHVTEPDLDDEVDPSERGYAACGCSGETTRLRNRRSSNPFTWVRELAATARRFHVEQDLAPRARFPLSKSHALLANRADHGLLSFVRCRLNPRNRESASHEQNAWPSSAPSPSPAIGIAKGAWGAGAPRLSRRGHARCRGGAVSPVLAQGGTARGVGSADAQAVCGAST